MVVRFTGACRHGRLLLLLLLLLDRTGDQQLLSAGGHDHLDLLIVRDRDRLRWTQTDRLCTGRLAGATAALYGDAFAGRRLLFALELVLRRQYDVVHHLAGRRWCLVQLTGLRVRRHIANGGDLTGRLDGLLYELIDRVVVRAALRDDQCAACGSAPRP